MSPRLRLLFFLFYFVLALLLTYPLFFLYEPHQLIGPPEDNMQSAWNPWHVQKALEEEGETLFTTRYLFYPQNFSLRMHTLSLTNAFFAMVLNVVFPLSYCYNLAIFFSFVLAGYFCFLLCYELTQHPYASFLAGFIFSFAPYHTARALHHINLASIFWFPLLVLYIWRSLQKPEPKNYFWITILYLLIAFTDYYYFIFAVCLGGLFLLFYLKKAKQLFVSLIFTFLLFLPIVILTFQDIHTLNFPKRTGQDWGVLDLLSFFVPPPWHSVFGGMSKEYFYNRIEINQWEMVGYLGYTVMVLSILGFYFNRQKKEVRFFGVLAILSLSLSVGSYLHIFGTPLIPAPYLLFKHLPVLNRVRIPSRWMVLVHLALAVLAAFGLKKILSGVQQSLKRKRVLGGLLFFLILFEYLCLPLPFTDIKVPPFYQTLAKDKAVGGVLNLPYGNYLYTNYYMYLQTIHQKPMLFGRPSRIYREAYHFINQYKFDEFFKNYQLSFEQQQILKQYKIQYIILNHFLMEEPEKAQESLAIKLECVYKDQKISVYKVY